jgi:hypothetical protein
MPLVQRNHEIQALTTHGSDQPFAIRIRLWRAHRRPQDPQPKRAFELLVQVPRENRIAIMDQELVTSVAGNGFPKLLQRPVCGGMRGHVVVENTATANFHYDENK